MYGHIAGAAESIKASIEGTGGKADILQVPETLPQEVLDNMNAPAKLSYPIITTNTILNYDVFLFGTPTRFGSMPAQWKVFWSSTGQLWPHGKLAGKYADLFVSALGLGGGQGVIAMGTMSTLTHHGMIYVPFGYSYAFGQLSNLEEPHGGSPWGAGTLASVDGSRQPSALELEIARIQGKSFYETVTKVTF
ncbi:NADH-quinone oxidoreductase [Crucibulum laeve]|uniref:NADH-quinone oxidoreductase n=1 Tax=Crucibulum laeve TaxID=68775 RepID=A0A5C3LUG0_9AGAR|nr:NADH-quinone oxidoreductase [Crucibulum laeve]